MERRKTGKKQPIEMNVVIENGVAAPVTGRLTGLKGDKRNIALLYFLYTLQGIPIGLSSAIPMIMQNRGVTYKQQAEFSFVMWPFSLKLMWAPIVDAIFSKRIGRRKSWMVPTQYLIGLFMLFISSNIESWLGLDGSDVNIEVLTILFFTLNFLAATQDIAVDGWALTMLKKHNIGHASTSNSCGQTTGFFLSFVIFMALESAEFCNTYLRSEPQDTGIITISGFLQFWGWMFMIVTSLVAVFKKEVEPEHIEVENHGSLKNAYTSLLDILKLRPVQILAFILLTCKIAFAPTDTAMTLKLIEGGIPKAKLALMVVPLIPIQIALPIFIAKYTTGPRPLEVFTKSVPWRLASVVFSMMIVWWTPTMIPPGTEDIPVTYIIVLLAWYVLHQVALYTMFVSAMAFFAKVSDPTVGGTYMTLLNAICNLGGNWPATLSLWFLDPLTFRDCVGGENNLGNTCRNLAEKDLCARNGGTCTTYLDGYYVESILSVIIGVFWLKGTRGLFDKIQTVGDNAWKVSKRTK